ncbi:MAG: hypothetical protein WBN11_04050 [Eudoraea sp.]|uniref:hypothetical protein n=1 Tax=Eudoraea sp. TaxID=1979955 RepID=UPI003C76C254
MAKIWVIAIAIFLIINFLFWWLTSGHFKKEYGEKVWKKWGQDYFIGKEQYLPVPELQF